MDRQGFYVEPTIISNLKGDAPVVMKETFAPILYVMKCSSLEEGIKINNQVDQGLSSSLFTQNLGQIFKVCSSVSRNQATFLISQHFPMLLLLLFSCIDSIIHHVLIICSIFSQCSGWAPKDLIAVLLTLTSQRAALKLVELSVERNIPVEVVNREVIRGSNTWDAVHAQSIMAKIYLWLKESNLNRPCQIWEQNLRNIPFMPLISNIY